MSDYDRWHFRDMMACEQEERMAATQGMTSPVRCRYCRRIYDLGKVEVTARYTDCSVWKAPCCGVTVDDRGDTGWKSFKDYEHVGRSR